MEKIEAPPRGLVLFFQPQMPLPDDSRVISKGLEDLRKHDGILRKVAPVIGRMGSNYPGHADKLLIAPAQQRRPGRRTHRTIRVKGIKTHPVGHQAVNVWSPEILGSVGCKVTISKVIHNDHNDIRSVTSGHRTPD